MSIFNPEFGLTNEEDLPFVTKNRNGLLDVLSGLWRGTGEALDIYGRGSDIDFIQNLGEDISQTSFAKPDIQTFSEGPGVLEAAAQSAPLSVPLLVSGGLGMASPVPGGAAIGTAAAGTALARGIYDKAYEQILQQRPDISEEDARNYALATTANETLTELISTGVDLFSAKIGGAFTKSAIKTALKNGILDTDLILKNIATKNTAKDLIAASGISAFGGGISEVAADKFQYALDNAYDLNPEEPDLFQTFLVGAILDGGFGLTASAMTNKEVKGMKTRLEEGLKSDDVDQRVLTASEVSQALRKASPEAADNWDAFVSLNVDKGPIPFDTPLLNDFIQELNKPSETGDAVIDSPDKILEEAGIDPGETNRKAFAEKKAYRDKKELLRQMMENKPTYQEPVARPEPEYTPELPQPQRQAYQEQAISQRTQEILDEETQNKVNAYNELKNTEITGMDRQQADVFMSNIRKLTDNRARVDAIRKGMLEVEEYSNQLKEPGKSLAERKKIKKDLKDTEDLIKEEVDDIIARAPKKIEQAKAKAKAKAPTIVGKSEGETAILREEAAAQARTQAMQQEKAKVEQAQAQEVLATKQEGERVTEGGWKTNTYEEGGKKVSVSERTVDNKKQVIRKNHSSSYDVFYQNQDGDIQSLGTFKSVSDAKKAMESETKAEDFYSKTKEKKEVALTEPQQALVASIDYGKVSGYALNKEGLRDDPEASGVVADAIIEAARRYKPESKTAFETYATSVALGKLKSYKKEQAKLAATEMQETGTKVDEGSEMEGQVASVTKEKAQESYGAALKEAPKNQEVITIGEKSVTLVKEGLVWKDKDSGKSYGNKKEEAIDKVTQEIAPKLKKISVEEYKKEQAAKAAKKGQGAKAAKKEGFTEQNKKRQDLAVSKAKENIPDLTVGHVVSVLMPSKKFLELSTSGPKTVERIQKEGFVEKPGEEYAEYDEGEAAAFKYDVSVAQEGAYPYLVINKEGKVVGHDGRHRAVFAPSGKMGRVTLIFEGDQVVGIDKIKPQFAKDSKVTSALNDTPYEITLDGEKYWKYRDSEFWEDRDGYAIIDEDINATLDKRSQEMKKANAAFREQRVAFFKKATTADKLLRFVEYAKRYAGVENRRLEAIANHILKNSGDKLKNIQVKESKEFWKDAKPEDKEQYTEDSLPYGFYYEGNLYISEKLVANTLSTEDLARTFVHEVSHAVTKKELETNPKFAKRMGKLLSLVRDNVLTTEEKNFLENEYFWSANEFQRGHKYNTSEHLESLSRFDSHTYYGLLNLDEFVAEALTNPELQDQMKQIKLKKPEAGGLIRNLWDKFVSYLASVFNIPQGGWTALNEMLSMTTALMQIDPVTNKRMGPSNLVPDLAVPMSKPSNQPAAKDDWAKRARTIRKNTSQMPIRDRAKGILSDIRSLGRDLVKSSSEVLRKIDPNLVRFMRKFEMNIVERNIESRKSVKEFLKKYKGLSVDDKNILDLTLMNTTEADVSKRNEILKRNGMTKEFNKVEEMLKKMYKEREDKGLNKYGEVSGYFPRRVKDYDKLVSLMKKDPNYSLIENELEGFKTQEEKEHAIRSLINTGRFPSLALLKGTSAKKRTIQRVSSEWKHVYENTPDALLNHIYETNELLAAHEMFADTPARKKMVDRRNTLLRNLERGKLSGSKRELAVAEVQQIEAYLDDRSKQFDTGLDSFLVKEAPNLEPEDAKRVINTIRARLTQRGMHGPLANLRNLSLMTALGSPTSAITQIGDLAFSIYKNGAARTIKAMFGPRTITARDLDLEHSMKEFQSEGTAKWLDRVLTVSGLKYMDLFGKNVSINASLDKAKSMSLEEFKSKWSVELGKDTEQTWKDIKAGKNNELTRYFAFNDLSNWQPVSLSEMPVKYLTAGNGRIFYALKSYNIKAINNIYRESVQSWRDAKTNTDRAQAAKNVGYLVLLMTMAGATADELKDLLLGKGANSFSDNVHENLLKIAFMSRYTLDQGFSKGFMETMLKDILLPPTGLVDDPMKDIIKTFQGEPSWKSVQNLPWGKLPYSWFSDGAEATDMNNTRKKIFATVVKGGSPSEVSEEIRRYNRWARQNDKTLITMKSLSNARKRQKD